MSRADPNSHNSKVFAMKNIVNKNELTPIKGIISWSLAYLKKSSMLLIALFSFSIIIPSVVIAADYSISIDDQNVTEGNTAGFTVTISPTVKPGDNVTVDYITNDDTAKVADNDYTAHLSTELKFTPGESTKPVNVVTTGDTKVEPDETFTVTLSNAILSGHPGSVTITDATGDGTITNDDTATLTIVGVIQNEGSGGGTTNFDFTVTLDNAVQDGFTVAYTTDDGTATVADGDYTDNDSSLSFAGTAAESHTITVAVSADDVIETDEAFTVALGAVTPVSADAGDIIKAGSPATGTITNDDRYQITINDIVVNENVGTAQFTVTVTPAVLPTDSVTVDYATSDGTATGGSDYTAIGSTTLTFNPGDTNQPVNVTIADDSEIEIAEDFFVDLSNASANAAINDNQGRCEISIDDKYDITINNTSVDEDVGTAQFTVTVVPAVQAGHTITVDYATADGSAGQPVDYTATSGTTTFSPGDTTQPITVPIINDTDDESTENFFVNLSNSTPADRTTISDTQGYCDIIDRR